MMIPELLCLVPSELERVVCPATSVELTRAAEIRREYLLPGQPEPFMRDVVRAMRLAEGKGLYIEVGTRDRGNIAYVSELLKPNATIIDIDIESMPISEIKIATEMRRNNFDYHFIKGDSVARDTVDRLKNILNGRLADVIFCDSSHLYSHTLSELAVYWPLVKPSGYLLFHDASWEGNEQEKGKLQALQAFDNIQPVYVIYEDQPPYRIIPRPEKKEVWGSVGIIVKNS